MAKILENKYIKFFSKLAELLLTIIILLYLTLIVTQRLTGNKSIFGIRVFTVSTGSMEPIYNINDVIMVNDIDKKKLKVGDDIAYIAKFGKMNNKIISHRIIEIDNTGDKTYIKTKGINNTGIDPTISEDQILGKITRKLVIISAINKILRNQLGFFLLIVCPLVLVVFLEFAETKLEKQIESGELVLSKENKRSDVDEEIL